MDILLFWSAVYLLIVIIMANGKDVHLSSSAIKKGFIMTGNTDKLFELMPESRALLEEINKKPKPKSYRRYRYRSRVDGAEINGGERNEKEVRGYSRGGSSALGIGNVPGGGGGGRMGGGLGGMGEGGLGGGFGGMGGDLGGGGVGGMVGRFGGRFMRAKGVSYIGRGYNLIFGNPDIIDLVKSQNQALNTAVDPGITANFIFNLTWMAGDIDRQGTFRVPDQVNYFAERVCYNADSKKLITGTKSYQKKLSSNFDKLTGFNIMGLVDRSFMGSQASYGIYGKSRHTQGVYSESRRVCTTAKAKYRLNNEPDKFLLNDDFKRAVCNLPMEYNQTTSDKYTKLLDEFGTSVIIGVVLGTLKVSRAELKTNALLTNAMNGTIDNSVTTTSVFGVRSMLNFNFNNATIDLNGDNELVKDTISWTIGTMANPKPTKLSIINIDEVLEDKFCTTEYFLHAHEVALDELKIMKVFNHCKNQDPEVQDCCSRVPEYRLNLRRALENYGNSKGVVPPTEEDDILKVPLNWPRGYYTLPATDTGCPEESENMKWITGFRLQTTHEKNEWKSDIHWDRKGLYQGYISQKFCTKDTDSVTSFDLDWPSGTYCIMRKGKTCPKGFDQGWIQWDDKNWSNINAALGMLPDGVYDTNTKIQYCCRDDAPPIKEIILPKLKPFYLMMYKNECQRVKGMTVREEWVHWDGWNWCFVCSRSYQAGGKHPRNDYYYENNKLYYCYYEPEEEVELFVLDSIGSHVPVSVNRSGYEIA